MLLPWFHNLAEAVRTCAEISDVPVAVLVGWLLAAAGLLLLLVTVRSRTRRF